MSTASENQPEVAPGPQDATAAAPDVGEEPPGPDLSGLNPGRLELLESALLVLEDFQPEPGALKDLPQVTIPRGHTKEACRRIKDDPRIAAKMLLCLSCVDYSEYFQLVYVLQSLEPERTLVLKTDVPYDDPTAPSVASVWRAADWYEREAHDLFGVNFEGHPDLSPLLLYEGFEGYPGRKEYPLYEYQEF